MSKLTVREISPVSGEDAVKISGRVTAQYDGEDVDIRTLAGGIQIGMDFPFSKSHPATPPLSEYFAELNGQIITDPDSPYYTWRIENKNGADVVLSGVEWASGVAVVDVKDAPAIGGGDFVIGLGIAENAYITGVTDNGNGTSSITMTDTSFSGTIDTTFTNNGTFDRGGLTSGVGKKDQMQLITGQFGHTGDGYVPGAILASGEGSFSGCFTGGLSTIRQSASIDGESTKWRSINFSSANSPNARTSDTTEGETHPHYKTTVYVRRIK